MWIIKLVLKIILKVLLSLLAVGIGILIVLAFLFFALASAGIITL